MKVIYERGSEECVQYMSDRPLRGPSFIVAPTRIMRGGTWYYLHPTRDSEFHLVRRERRSSPPASTVELIGGWPPHFKEIISIAPIGYQRKFHGENWPSTGAVHVRSSDVGFRIMRRCDHIPKHSSLMREQQEELEETE